MPGSHREDGAPWRNFYGRRRGKALRPVQVRHLAETLPRLLVPAVGWDENPQRAAIDPASLFGVEGGAVEDLRLEIGFGGGEHLLHQAAANPQARFIGCEPFVNGVAMLLPKIAELDLRNVRLHPGDARDLLDVLPEGCLSLCYLLYPDPWPKTRHHGRRFVNAANLDALARVLRHGAELRVATDIPDYVRHSLEAVARHDAFEWLAESPRDWRLQWPGWTETRYEAKALREGRRPHYLRFRRVRDEPGRDGNVQGRRAGTASD